MNNLPWMELTFPEFAIIDIKYDWPSFEGVMDIVSLWNELLGLEYCIRETFKKIKASDKSFSDISENDLVILVEPFQNNCFREKIKISTIRKEINKLTNKEITIWIAVWTLIVHLVVNTISWIYTIVKDFTDEDMNQITMENITTDLLNKIWDNLKAELLSDKKFRKEICKIASPLGKDNDFVEIRTNDVEWKENLVTIDKTNKNNFLWLWNIDKIVSAETSSIKSEKLYWRINAIDLDAIKRQIWFKIDWEWKEIDCYLVNWLEIYDYKNLLWKRVIIEGITSYTWTIPDKVEIEKITESTPPIREAKNIALDL